MTASRSNRDRMVASSRSAREVRRSSRRWAACSASSCSTRARSWRTSLSWADSASRPGPGPPAPAATPPPRSRGPGVRTSGTHRACDGGWRSRPCTPRPARAPWPAPRGGTGRPPRAVRAAGPARGFALGRACTGPQGGLDLLHELGPALPSRQPRPGRGVHPVVVAGGASSDLNGDPVPELVVLQRAGDRGAPQARPPVGREVRDPSYGGRQAGHLRQHVGRERQHARADRVGQGRQVVVGAAVGSHRLGGHVGLRVSPPRRAARDAGRPRSRRNVRTTGR